MEGSNEVEGKMEEDGDHTTRHHESLPCSTHCKFNHMRAKAAIYEDFLYIDSLHSFEFKLIFCI